MWLRLNSLPLLLWLVTLSEQWVPTTLWVPQKGNMTMVFTVNLSHSKIKQSIYPKWLLIRSLWIMDQPIATKMLLTGKKVCEFWIFWSSAAVTLFNTQLLTAWYWPLNIYLLSVIWHFVDFHKDYLKYNCFTPNLKVYVLIQLMFSGSVSGLLFLSFRSIAAVCLCVFMCVLLSWLQLERC